MSWTKVCRKSKNAIDIEEYHTARYGAPGQKRQEKKKLTPEQMRRVNQYTKERKARWRIRLYFDTDDYFICLTYKKQNRPEDMEAAKKDFKKFIDKVRDEYKKRGEKLRWIRNIERGTRGAWHIHLLINRVPDADLIVKKAWKKGTIKFKLLYSDGEFRKLASYITKTSETDTGIRESSYSCSRNMPLPDPEVKVYRKWKTWGKIRIPKGFYMDEETFHEGVNPITGYKYRRYTLLRARRE